MQREPGLERSFQAPLTLAPGRVLDFARGELLDADGRPVELRAQALQLLLVLGERAGQVVGKDELQRRIWGDVIVTEDSLVQAVGDIRRALGDGERRILRTVPRRGYLLAVDPAAPPLAGPASRRWKAMLAGALAVVLVAAAIGWALRPAADAPPPRSLAILPFESDGGADDWFVDGVDGDLRAIVASWSGIAVTGRGTMATYKGRRADPREVGRELGVRFVLAGSARRDGDRVRLAVSLVEARSGQVAWSDLRDVPRAELPALVGDVAGGIARTLMVELGDAVAADTRRLAAHQVQADDLAMKAMAQLLRSVSAPAFESARQTFEEALRIDPNCYRCLAGVSLSNSNLVLWEWTSDRAAAIARAEETLAQMMLVGPERLLTGMAQASMANIRRDWPGVLDVGNRLVAHFPTEPGAHAHRCSALLRLGRFDESVEACQRAMRISPKDSRVATWQGLTGFAEFQRGRHAAAEQQLRASVLANPRVPFYGVVLAAAIAEQGRRDEAVQALNDTLSRHPDYRRERIPNYWVATDPRFLAGRDRIVAVAAELGMP